MAMSRKSSIAYIYILQHITRPTFQLNKQETYIFVGLYQVMTENVAQWKQVAIILKYVNSP